MTTFVSLFRSINVGGHQTIRMDELKDLYESLGFKDVTTYIQSGNVVCTSDDANVAQLPRHIEDGFAQKFGFHVKVIVRTSAEFRNFKGLITQGTYGKEPIKTFFRGRTNKSLERRENGHIWDPGFAMARFVALKTLP
jgi:Protein of unknown function (DUF1697)